MRNWRVSFHSEVPFRFLLGIPETQRPQNVSRGLQSQITLGCQPKDRIYRRLEEHTASAPGPGEAFLWQRTRPSPSPSGHRLFGNMGCPAVVSTGPPSSMLYGVQAFASWSQGWKVFSTETNASSLEHCHDQGLLCPQVQDTCPGAESGRFLFTPCLLDIASPQIPT